MNTLGLSGKYVDDWELADAGNWPNLLKSMAILIGVNTFKKSVIIVKAKVLDNLCRTSELSGEDVRMRAL